MNVETQEYIHNVKVEDIPWHRITTTYGRATDFPKYFEILSKMEDWDAVKNAGEEIAMNIEHQSTLWHAKPFAMIFLYRILKNALEQRDKNEIAKYLAEELEELFTEIEEAVKMVEEMEHAKELPQFSDMLREEYLWSQDYDEEEDEIRYEEDEVFPDDLFYSFYYYSTQVLELCKTVLDEKNNFC